MARAKKTLNARLRDAVMPTVSILIVAFFAGYALFGSNGALAWGEYSQAIEARRGDLVRIERERAVLANRVKLLDPKKADPDMVDELVRRDLGVAHPDELIVPLP
ncbi:MAG: FtsB family cell division protein [Sphingomonadaceae bacterium]